jgi:hypothetical protein
MFTVEFTSAKTSVDRVLVPLPLAREVLHTAIVFANATCMRHAHANDD